MKAAEIMNELFAWAEADFSGKRTCDTLKAGSPDRVVKKVAVTCFDPVDVIRRAADWGADLLITHEPTYYDHWEERGDLVAIPLKRKIIEDSGMTIYRYHDHPHIAPTDLIYSGVMEALGLEIALKRTGHFGMYRQTLPEPVTPRELAKRIEEKLNIAHVRICGAADEPMTTLSMAVGAAAGILEELDGEGQIVVTGETCEWRECEYARDLAALGFKKALLLLGHCGSERQGMRFVADMLRNAHPELEVKYFDTDEVYTYAE